MENLESQLTPTGTIAPIFSRRCRTVMTGYLAFDKFTLTEAASSVIPRRLRRILVLVESFEEVGNLSQGSSGVSLTRTAKSRFAIGGSTS